MSASASRQPLLNRTRSLSLPLSTDHTCLALGTLYEAELTHRHARAHATTACFAHSRSTKASHAVSSTSTGSPASTSRTDPGRLPVRCVQRGLLRLPGHPIRPSHRPERGQAVSTAQHALAICFPNPHSKLPDSPQLPSIALHRGAAYAS